jgi:hypothetical protein
MSSDQHNIDEMSEHTAREVEQIDVVEAEKDRDTATKDSEVIKKEGIALEAEPKAEAKETAVLSLADTVVTPKPSKKRSKRQIFTIALIALINIGMAGASVYLLFVKKPITKTAAEPVAITNLASQSKTDNPPASQPTEAKILHYVSEPLKLEFDYPNDWHISSGVNDSYIEIKSGPVNVEQPDGTLVYGPIVITIQKNYSDDNFMITENTAIGSASEQLTYDSPTNVQRKQTNLSFITYGSGDLSGVFVSGNLVYKKGDKVGSKNFKNINPFISLYVDACYDRPCQAFQAGEFSLNTFHTHSSFQKLSTLIKSLRIH